MSLNLRYAALSDRGLIRDGNQDSLFAGPRLLAVADGMGGMAAGDVASNVVIGALAPLDDDVPGPDLVDALRNAVAAANEQLRATVAANPRMEGMGTTLTAMLFSGTRFALVHVGDSRAYLVRDGAMTQITKDDSYVQMLVDEGRITPEEAVNHPQRSLITRALQGEDVEPEFSVREARPGDRYLICSDGLHGFVSNETITETILATPDAARCVDRLVQLALRAGGPDNVSVIIADVVDGPVPNQQPIVGGAASGDRGLVSVADPNSPAARAAAAQRASQPPAPEDDDPPGEEERPRRHPVRNTLIVVAILAVVGGIGAGLWQYTRSQYFVGATPDGYVAVYRGVPGSVAGLQLSSLDVKSDTKVADLTQSVRSRLKQGINTPSRTQAINTLHALTNDSNDNPNMLPVCPTPSPSPSASGNKSHQSGLTPTPSGSGKRSASPHPSHSQSASPSPSPSPSPTPSGECRPGR